MLRLFNDNKPYVLFLLPLFVGIFFLTFHLTDSVVYPEVLHFGLWGKLNDVASSLNWLLLFGFLAHLLCCISLNYVFNQSNLFERNNYLPSLLSSVFLLLSPLSLVFNGNHLAIFCLILSLYQLLHLQQNDSGTSAVFNATLFFGIAATVFPSLIVGSPVLFFLVLIYRPLVPQEILSFILGLFLPFYFVMAFRNYFDFPYPWHELHHTYTLPWLSPSVLSLLALTFILFVVFLLSIVRKWQGFSNRTKKEVQTLWGFLIIVGISGLFHLIFQAFDFYFLLLIVPVSLLFTFAFLGKGKHRVAGVLFYFFLTYIVTKFIFKL